MVVKKRLVNCEDVGRPILPPNSACWYTISDIVFRLLIALCVRTEIVRDYRYVPPGVTEVGTY